MATLSRSKLSVRVLISGVFALVAFVLCMFALKQGGRNLSYAAGASPSMPSCDLSWKVVPGPNPDPEFDIFSSVSALSSTDIWAVGAINNYKGTLAEHWDGTQWTVFPTPNFGLQLSEISGVAAVASNDVWAVGTSYGPDPNVKRVTYAIHWNGAAWTQVTIPILRDSRDPNRNVTSLDDYDKLSGIEALSANDIWITGEAHRYSEFPQVLMLHWDGVNWTRFLAPSPGSDWNRIEGIEALAPNDIWAVGYYRIAGEQDKTLALHWDGTAWTLSPSINANRRNFLNDVAPVAASNVWAVGYSISDIGDVRPTMFHWDGTAWSEITLASPPSGSGYELDGITAISATDIWAVGIFGIAYHWDGSTWTLSDIEEATYLEDITALSSSNIWAVGSAHNGPLAQRYSTDCALPTFTPTATPTATNTPLPPRCAGERFTDVCPGDYFYTPVLSLNDAGIVSGYNSTPPCIGQSHVPCYLPRNNLTRGQIAKIVSLAINQQDPIGDQHFEDIGLDHTFYTYIERLVMHGIISGYPCGRAGEPCVPPDNRPYYRAGANVSRGQLSKLTSEAFDYDDAHTEQTFEDVPTNSTFYIYIERLASRTIINGYGCGGQGEPCNPALNRPYFRPGSFVTRDQTAKIVYNARAMVSPTATPTSAAKPKSP